MCVEEVESNREVINNTLENFRKAIIKYEGLLRILEKTFQDFKYDEKPTRFFEEWDLKTQSQKLYFVGWVYSGIYKIDFRTAFRYINLSERNQLDNLVKTIKEEATQGEVKYFENGAYRFASKVSS